MLILIDVLMFEVLGLVGGLEGVLFWDWGCIDSWWRMKYVR
jgi:hypothetical protein